MSAGTTKSAEAEPRPVLSRGARRGGKGTGPRLGDCGPVPASTPDKPSVREVRAALAVAIPEADRDPCEIEEAVEAYRRGGVQGLYEDQGRSVATRVLALVERARERAPADPSPAPEPVAADPGPDPEADPDAEPLLAED